MAKQKVLAFVMAGGAGSRLHPLTANRSKPSVPFGARYRIVDFALSNLVNSEIYSIYLLVQYKSQSLIEHIRNAWVLSPILPEQFVTVVPPQMHEGPEWFQGTADAVYQNLGLIAQHQPSLVAVFGADHIYRMDIRQMVSFHEEHNADVTISALPVPIEQASSFGIMTTDTENRIVDFQEKPTQPNAIPKQPHLAYASMGNYIFKTSVLEQALQEANQRGEHDFGHNVLPKLIRTHRVYAYNFADNLVPGIRPYEDPSYWRDVGTIDTYFAAHQDVLGLEPRVEIFNPHWPIISSNYQGPVAKIISGDIQNSILAGGTLVNGATVRNSVIRREVILDDDVEIDNCIIMDYSHICRGSRLRRAIVDRFNVIKPNTTIGYDHEADAKRFHVTPSGVAVVPDSMMTQGARERATFEHHG
jgi:glucose-1-phosphate adenylyltransferase